MIVSKERIKTNISAGRFEWLLVRLQYIIKLKWRSICCLFLNDYSSNFLQVCVTLKLKSANLSLIEFEIWMLKLVKFQTACYSTKFSVMFTYNLCYYLMEMQFNQSSNALLHPSSILLYLLLTCTWISYSKFEDLTSSTPIQTWQTPVKVQAHISWMIILLHFFLLLFVRHIVMIYMISWES